MADEMPSYGFIGNLFSLVGQLLNIVLANVEQPGGNRLLHSFRTKRFRNTNQDNIFGHPVAATTGVLDAFSNDFEILGYHAPIIRC